tara:strand:- start:436 stop:783 length:348 start_codon:yes stop_codon:yes gene_type:complete
MINDLGVDPNEWFDNPLDKMPIAKDEPIKYDNKYAPPEKIAELESMQSIEPNPRPEEEIAAEWFEEKKPEEPKTIHQHMYEIATNRYNPFSVGGSENCDSDISCNTLGGSEKIHD